MKLIEQFADLLSVCRTWKVKANFLTSAAISQFYHVRLNVL